MASTASSLRKLVLLVVPVFLCVASVLAADGDVDKKSVDLAVKEGASTPLLCHVGGTMRPAIEALAAAYEKTTGQKFEINSNGSGELLAHIELQKAGDLYICHDPFLAILMNRGLGVDGWTFAELTPVLVVRKDNPKKILGLKDFERKDVEVVLPDYTQSTLGYLLPTIFAKAGVDLEKLKSSKNIPTNRSGGNAANVVATGNADATLVWNAVASLRKKDLDAIRIDGILPTPNVDAVTSATSKSYYLTPVKVTVATLTCAKQAAAAKAFAEFLASPKAAKILADFEYTINPAITRKCYEAGKPLSKPMP